MKKRTRTPTKITTSKTDGPVSFEQIELIGRRKWPAKIKTVELIPVGKPIIPIQVPVSSRVKSK